MMMHPPTQSLGLWSVEAVRVVHTLVRYGIDALRNLGLGAPLSKSALSLR